MSPPGWNRAHPSAREETLNITPPDPRSIHFRKQVERWFLELRDPVLRYLLNLGCRHTLAEEIAQEAFFRLHRALCDGLVVNEVRAWVYHVARNLHIDSQREDRRFWAWSPDDWNRNLETNADSSLDPEQRVLHRERIRHLAEEFSRLPELQRECMRLKAHGLRYREIAAVLGIPMTAAVGCVRQGVKRLGRRFKYLR